jgi:hypothetical protein
MPTNTRRSPTPRSALGRAAAVLAALLLSAAAQAAQLITLEDECRGKQLLIQGTIEPGDFDRLVARLRDLAAGADLPDVQDPETLWTVKLDSPGGDVAEAMRIGRLLRGALATTESSYRFARRDDGVYDFQRTASTVCLDGKGRLDGCFEDVVKAECAGACLLVWAAGATRYAHEGGLGLHGLTGADPATLRAYLVEMDVPSEWVERIASAGAGTEPSDERALDRADDRADDRAGEWLSWPERKALSGNALALRDLLTSCPAALTFDEAFDSVTAESERVRDALMDRAEAHRHCRIERVASARAPVVEALLLRGSQANAH